MYPKYLAKVVALTALFASTSLFADMTYTYTGGPGAYVLNMTFVNDTGSVVNDIGLYPASGYINVLQGSYSGPYFYINGQNWYQSGSGMPTNTSVTGLYVTDTAPAIDDGQFPVYYTLYTNEFRTTNVYQARYAGVPDGGATAGLIAFALLGFAALRRRFLR